MLTVNELIEELQKHDGDVPVYFLVEDGYFYPISRVSTMDDHPPEDHEKPITFGVVLETELG